ncbi:hypothetical protein D9M73_208670 [compost metagenome]
MVPTQPASSESSIDLKHRRDPQEQTLLLREEQRRQQQRRRPADDAHYNAVPGEEVNADNTVPVAPLMDQGQRQGLLVDIEV